MFSACILLGVCGCPSKKENKPLPKPETAASPKTEPEKSESENQANASLDSQAVTEAESKSDQTAEAITPPDPLRDGTWTSKRLVLLAPAGPSLVEVMMNIEGESLETSSNGAISDLANELLAARKEQEVQTKSAMQATDEVAETGTDPNEGEQESESGSANGEVASSEADEPAGPVTWEQLLTNELVRSGWLGNLIARDDQEDELISMYDDGDGIVTAAELEPFLTRGLNRQGAVIFTDRSGDSDANGSPWGYADLNNDFSLTFDEIDQLSESIRKYDLNGDSIIGMAEVTRSSTSEEMSMMGGSMLALNSAIQLPLRELTNAESAESLTDEQTKQASQAAKEILQHYTFLSAIEREVWSGWSDERWNAIDENGDNEINRTELARLMLVEPDLQIAVRLPAATSREGLAFGANAGGQSWNQAKTAGMHGDANARTRVVIEDDFRAETADSLKTQLALALSNSQLQEVIRQQLDLQENAFEVLDADQDEMLSDEEFEAVWSWLSIRNSGRVMMSLEMASQRWLHLLDIDGDDRITDHEVAMATSDLRELDRDGDKMIAPVEIPMTVTLRLRRQEDRINVNLIPGTQSDSDEPEAIDWFAAMDTNQDGSVSRTEFLGSEDDFAELDRNSDRFIERQELVP